MRSIIRHLARSPGFTAVAVLTLAIGLGGLTAVFSAVDHVLLQPLASDEPGRLARIYQYYEPPHGSPDERGFATPVHYVAYRERLSSFETVAAINTYNETGADLGARDRPERIRLLEASADYFEALRAGPALGRGFDRTEETGALVVVLSDVLWRREFRGERGALGRSLLMSGKPYTVVGVMPPDWVDPVVGRIDAWVPLDLRPGRDPQNAGNHYLTVVARRRPGVTLARAQAELDRVDLSLAGEYQAAKFIRARIYPLKEDLVAPVSRSLELALGAVVVVVLLVCVNLANLLLVRGSDRARELAVRGALGASRARLVGQLLLECLALAAAGNLAALGVARLAMSTIVTLGAQSIPRLTSLTLDLRLFLFSAIAASACAIGFGLVPALRSTRERPLVALGRSGRSATAARGEGRLRNGLVVAQVSLAFLLVVTTGLLLASLHRLRSVNLGVETDHALTFGLALPEARYDSTARARMFERFAAVLERSPGVVAAGGISRLPATGTFHRWSAEAASGPLAGRATDEIEAEQRIVSGHYFRAAGIRIVAGRAFDERDVVGTPDRVLISRSVAERLFPGIDPIGQRLQAGGRTNEVIGVANEVAVDLEGDVEPTVYHPHAQFAGDRNWELEQVIAGRGPADELDRTVRDALAAEDPELVMYRPMPLADALGRGARGRLFTTWLLSAFAAVAVGLAAVGLFGVLSYTVRLRSREFGIRMALGAERGQIRAMVLRTAVVVTAAGLVIGLLGTLAMSRVIASLVFHTSGLDPIVLGGSMAFIAAVAAAASYLPGFRATRVDPRVVLQSE